MILPPKGFLLKKKENDTCMHKERVRKREIHNNKRSPTLKYLIPSTIRDINV